MVGLGIHLPDYYDDLGAFALVVGLIGSGLATWRKGIPAWRRRRAREAAKDEALLGRERIPANPITGEAERPRIPPLGDRLAAQDERLEYLIGKVHEVEHEVKNNNGSSLKDSTHRLESEVAGLKTELADLRTSLAETLHVSAEANREVWPAIKTAIEATPPSATQE